MGADQGMGRRKIMDGLEQDVFRARHRYTYTENIRGLVRFAKRKANRRERREGQRQARTAGE